MSRFFFILLIAVILVSAVLFSLDLSTIPSIVSPAPQNFSYVTPCDNEESLNATSAPTKTTMPTTEYPGANIIQSWLTSPQHQSGSPPVSIDEAIQRGIKRYLTVAGTNTSFTATDCIDASYTCGYNCGNEQKEWFDSACWCVQLYKKELRYFSKANVYVNHKNSSAHSWKVDTFVNLHSIVNMIQLVVEESSMEFPSPVYLVINAFDFPRAFAAAFHPTVPRLTRSHPGEAVRDILSFRPRIANAGFPTPRTRKEFKCSTPLRAFPILSWSVNPVFNFDLLVPHKHASECLAPVFDQDIYRIPWEEKQNIISFHGSGIDDCDPEHESNHRQRFCGYVQARKEQWEQALNVTISINNTFVSPLAQARSKFLVLLDGAVAAFRSTWYLPTGSVIFATGVHVDVRTALLIPYVHYIPFKPDYSDFFEQLSMVSRDDQYAKWVGGNARALAMRISLDSEGRFDNGFSFDKLYWSKMLDVYRKSFAFVDNLGPDLKAKFTEDRSCETFDQIAEESCFKDRAYACGGILEKGYPGSIKG